LQSAVNRLAFDKFGQWSRRRVRFTANIDIRRRRSHVLSCAVPCLLSSPRTAHTARRRAKFDGSQQSPQAIRMQPSVADFQSPSWVDPSRTIARIRSSRSNSCAGSPSKRSCSVARPFLSVSPVRPENCAWRKEVLSLSPPPLQLSFRCDGHSSRRVLPGTRCRVSGREVHSHAAQSAGLARLL
jgi:hypothetical protein